MIFLLSAVPLFAQDTPVGPEGTQVATEETPAAATNVEELRKQSQNPVASLISVPIQDNWNFNIGPTDHTQNVLNIQLVIPLSLTRNWNPIVRWITLIIYQPILVTLASGLPVQTTGVYGLGDMNPSFFLVPKKEQDNLGYRADVSSNEPHMNTWVWGLPIIVLTVLFIYSLVLMDGP